MSAKHRDPEYVGNARIIRSQVAMRRRAGQSVECWRCGNEIDPEQRWDVGHRDPDAGHHLGNLSPEHRYKSGRCIGNRADGGRRGAAIQKANRARVAPRPAPSAPTSTDLLKWWQNT